MLEDGVERRLVAPPVRNACLSCRSLKTRCDGGNPCTSCQIRARDCAYRPSKRGGARVRKNRRSPEQAQYSSSETSIEDTPQLPLPLDDFILPGAGLKQLPDLSHDSDYLFDSLFLPDVFDVRQTPPSTTGPLVRAYQSDYAILEAYYIYIHPFFPILPPPVAVPVDLAISRPQDHVPDFESQSPVGLAIAAVLALIPCTDDSNPRSQDSLQYRRKYAQYLNQTAMETIENEKDISEAIDPSDALAGAEEEFRRQPFHPGVPAELEDVIALDILSYYEYAQRGNLKKMQSRAGQALISAMALSLHECPEGAEYEDVKGRIWWMTYFSALQATIVSNSDATSMLLPQSSSTRYPQLQFDFDAFRLLIQAQQTLLACTRFATELAKIVKLNGDMSRPCAQMTELEHTVEPLTRAADSWPLSNSSTLSMDGSEEVVSRALRCMTRIKLNSARIKVHRLRAFFDRPIFSGKYCDFESTTPDMQLLYSTSPDPLVANLLPFSRHESTKICLRAALNIAQTFNLLPFPNPKGQPSTPPLVQDNEAPAPRMMPSLACCAMQCTYTLVMVHDRMEPPAENSPAQSAVGNLLGCLQASLRSVFALFENYATAFEAIGGIRDRVREVLWFKL